MADVVNNGAINKTKWGIEADKLNAKFNSIDLDMLNTNADIAIVNGRLDGVDSDLTTINGRLDGVDSDLTALTRAQAIQILKQQDSSLIFQGFAKPGDDTPVATLNHAYIVTEAGTVFGVEATEGQVLVGDGDSFSKYFYKYKVYPPLIEDPRYSAFIDSYYGSSNTIGKSIKPIQIFKSSGRIVCRDENNISYLLDYLGEKKGIKLHKVPSGTTHHIWLLIDWDRVFIDISDINQSESFAVAPPRTPILRELFSMLTGKNFKIKETLSVNEIGIPYEFLCTWADGTEGTVLYSNFDENILEYKDCSATYKDYTVIYGTVTYNDLGFEASSGNTVIK